MFLTLNQTDCNLFSNHDTQSATVPCNHASQETSISMGHKLHQQIFFFSTATKNLIHIFHMQATCKQIHFLVIIEKAIIFLQIPRVNRKRDAFYLKIQRVNRKGCFLSQNRKEYIGKGTISHNTMIYRQIMIFEGWAEKL